MPPESRPVPPELPSGAPDFIPGAKKIIPGAPASVSGAPEVPPVPPQMPAVPPESHPGAPEFHAGTANWIHFRMTTDSPAGYKNLCGCRIDTPFTRHLNLLTPMTRSYFPDGKDNQSHWYANMAAEFPGVATTLGFNTADAAAWVADCLYAAYLLGPLTDPFSAFTSALIGFANTIVTGGGQTVPLPAIPVYDPKAPAAVAPGIDGRRQTAVDRIKKATNYTPLVIGKLLQTENTGQPFDPATVAGVIRSFHLNPQGQPVIAFGKAGGHIDGVNLYMQRGTAAAVKLGMFTSTPAVDPTPLLVPGTPEQRTYTVQPVLKDVEIGVRSPAVSLLVN